MDNIINQDGPDQYSIPKIDAWEAGTADNTMYAIRVGVGRVKINKYKGKCVKCSAWIEAQDGLLVKVGAGYGVSHKSGACSA